MNSHSQHICNCKNDNRTIVLLAKNFHESFPELMIFSKTENWTYLPEFGALSIEVGGDARWSGIADVLNFLRTVVTDVKRLEQIRAAWVNGSQPLGEQLINIIYDAKPVLDFAPAESSELLEILQRRRIETWFQPVISATDNSIWGYECLMRGRKTNGDLVSAPQLLDWAKQESLTFMLDRVCREIHLENAGRQNLGVTVKFLINFLPTAIYQPEFCLASSMAATLRSGLKPEQIIFEVVETEKVEDNARLQKILEFYRQNGFGVALDDMGSGYSGLSLLADLKPDLVKIDREIVSKSVASKYHFDICASLARLGKENGQMVLAEGVETEQEKELMDKIGVDLYQGYLFGKPNPVPLAQNINVDFSFGARPTLSETYSYLIS